jgi:hypothetical protein
VSTRNGRQMLGCLEDGGKRVGWWEKFNISFWWGLLTYYNKDCVIGPTQKNCRRTWVKEVIAETKCSGRELLLDTQNCEQCRGKYQLKLDGAGYCEVYRNLVQPKEQAFCSSIQRPWKFWNEKMNLKKML